MPTVTNIDQVLTHISRTLEPVSPSDAVAVIAATITNRLQVTAAGGGAGDLIAPVDPAQLIADLRAVADAFPDGVPTLWGPNDAAALAALTDVVLDDLAVGLAVALEHGQIPDAFAAEVRFLMTVAEVTLRLAASPYN